MPFEFRSTPHLAQWATRLREAPRRIHEEVAREVERGILEVIDRQFENGADPLGKPWILAKDGHTPPMIRTGALRAGFSVRCTVRTDGLRLGVSNSREYAKFLQTGTWKMLPRIMVPGGTLMAPRWREVIAEAYRRAIQRWLFGR